MVSSERESFRSTTLKISIVFWVSANLSNEDGLINKKQNKKKKGLYIYISLNLIQFNSTKNMKYKRTITSIENSIWKQETKNNLNRSS